MTNKILEEYVGRVRAELHALADDERDAVIDEMRAHLEDAISQRMAVDGYTDLEAATLAETRAFGEPAEIGAARGVAASAEPAVPPTLPTRPPRRFPRWAPYAAAGLIVLVAFVVAANAGNSTEYFGKQFLFGEPYQAKLNATNQTGMINESFVLPEGTDHFRLHALVEPVAGCVGVRVTDPHGSFVLNEWDSCGAMNHTITLDPENSGKIGRWQVEVRYTNFTGTLAIETTFRGWGSPPKTN